MLNRFRRDPVRASPPASSDAIVGLWVQGGQTVPLSVKTVGTWGAGIQAQVAGRKTLRADDAGLALAYASNPIAHRCVDLRAQKVAEMPHRVVQKGTKTVVEDHPFILALESARLYWRKSLLYLWQSAKCIHGEAYIEKVRDQFGRPLTLRWLNPLAVEPYVLYDAIQYFEYQSDTSALLQLKPESVVYDYYHNPLDDYRGLSPMQVALPSVNILNGIQEYQNSFFQNDARPGGILSARQGTHVNTTDQKRLKSFWDEQTAGARKAFRTIFMPAALEYQAVQQTPTPEHTEVERGAIRKICDAFGVPTPLVDLDEMRFQLSEQQPKTFYENTVIPDCMEIAEVINGDLLPWFDAGGEVVFEFDFDKIRALLDDQVKRSTAINSRVLSGTMSINEARQEYGQEAWKGGDQVFLPKASMLVAIDDLPTIDQLTQTSAADTATPDANGAAVPNGNTNPRQDNAQKEMKAWAKVARRSGVVGALGFRTFLTPPEIAEAVRGQLFALGDAASPDAVKAVFDDAARQLRLLFDEAEEAGLRERLTTLGMEALLEPAG
jgi:HK97 family phage portal protein